MNALALLIDHRPRVTVTALLLGASVLLGACSDDDGGGSGNRNIAGNPFANRMDTSAVAFVSSATFSSDAGQIERLIIGSDIVSTGVTPATGSDIRVATNGTDVYEIGRFELDTLTRFDIADLLDPIYQYSVNGAESQANPYAVVFLNENKAYVTRRGSPLVWIVDPAATTEANFRIGTIDLGAYDDDGQPDMTDAILVDDRLYVLMERLDENFAPTENGYVAVIDTDTDTEVPTGQGQDGLDGIALLTGNPVRLQYLPESDEVYVVGRGNIFENATVQDDFYNGGIEVIDPDTFENELLLDDGNADENQDFFADALIVSPTKGYVLTYAAFQQTTLRSFNPMTGILDDDVVAGLADQDIAVLALGPAGRLWVGMNTEEGPGFRLLDTADDSVLVQRVPTEFMPTGIVFIERPDTTNPDTTPDTTTPGIGALPR